MQRLRNLWIAGRLVLQASQPCRPRLGATYQATTFARSYSRRRPREPTPNLSEVTNLPSFEIPLAILDLDAENNPYVRSYTAEDDEEQAKVWGDDSEFDAVVARMHDLKKELRNSRLAWHKPRPDFDVSQISAKDIFQVAFLGSPKRDAVSPAKANPAEAEIDQGTPQPTAESGLLTRDILWSLGLSDIIIDDHRQTLLTLLARLRLSRDDFTEDKRSRSGNIMSITNRRNMLNSALKNTNDLSSIRRMVAPYLRDRSGLMIVAAEDSMIERACLYTKSQRSNEAYESRKKSFINNLTINLASHRMWDACRSQKMASLLAYLKSKS